MGKTLTELAAERGYILPAEETPAEEQAPTVAGNPADGAQEVQKKQESTGGLEKLIMQLEIGDLEQQSDFDFAAFNEALQRAIPKAKKDTERIINAAKGAIANAIAQAETSEEVVTAAFKTMVNVSTLYKNLCIPWMDELQEIAENDDDPEAKAAAEKALEEIPRIIAELPESIDFPLDKVNRTIWRDLQASKPNGQIQFDMAKAGSGREAITLFSLDFDELPEEVSINKRLTAFDERCMMAVDAIQRINGDIMTATQIYKAMGNTKQPSAADLKKVNDSLTKMGTGRVFIDNSQELPVNKKYSHFKYDGPIVPFERCSAYMNGKLCESAIHIFRAPPLMDFSRERKQVTTINRKLLESPVSKSPAHLTIDHYLIERIARMKDGNANKKMLLEKIYEDCNITGYKQKSRAAETIKRYLTHYQSCGYIKNFTMLEDGIKIDT